VSGRVRRCFLTVETCSARSGYCRDLFDEVGFVSAVFGEIGLVLGHVRRGFLTSRRVRQGRISVGTFSSSSN